MTEHRKLKKAYVKRQYTARMRWSAREEDVERIKRLQEMYAAAGLLPSVPLLIRNALVALEQKAVETLSA